MMEFNYKENCWRVRNLQLLVESIKKPLGLTDVVTHAFLSHVFNIARRRVSAILWMPSDLDSIEDLLISKNILTSRPLSILDSGCAQTIFRYMSSDGATVLSKEGNVVFFGAVVDISKISVSGLKGTGESVAKLLGRNGVSIKVSQDGTIKLYSEKISFGLIF